MKIAGATITLCDMASRPLKHSANPRSQWCQELRHSANSRSRWCQELRLSQSPSSQWCQELRHSKIPIYLLTTPYLPLDTIPFRKAQPAEERWCRSYPVEMVAFSKHQKVMRHPSILYDSLQSSSDLFLRSSDFLVLLFLGIRPTFSRFARFPPSAVVAAVAVAVLAVVIGQQESEIGVDIGGVGG